MTVCGWRPEWKDVQSREQSRLTARLGVEDLVTSGLRVVADEGVDVPADGMILGEC